MLFQGSHPALRMKSEDGRGFYEDEGPSSSANYNSNQKQSQSYSSDVSGKDQEWRQYDKQLDSDMGKLKTLLPVHELSPVLLDLTFCFTCYSS